MNRFLPWLEMSDKGVNISTISGVNIFHSKTIPLFIQCGKPLWKEQVKQNSIQAYSDLVWIFWLLLDPEETPRAKELICWYVFENGKPFTESRVSGQSICQATFAQKKWVDFI